MSETKAPDPTGKPQDRRKLIAVVYADMVGYSRLIGLDDVGTLQHLRILRKDLIDPAIEEYGGRLVNTGGDSLLIVFDSIDGAVRCAMKVQQHVPTHDADQPPDRTIRFRVGINVGDVIPDGSDVHGDVVNVAARLQAECPPGGICVTRPVRDHVRDRLDLAFEELGALNLKNIARPVEAYLVRSDSAASLRLFEPSLASSGGQLLPLPDKPSIAVLPFDNLSTDPEQEYFSDGVADDIITELSRSRSLFVIARNSSFTYRRRAVDVRQVGRELGVRYVLEGSVRRSGTRVRVVAQLIEAETGNHIWAERYDRALNDVFVMQDEITATVVTAIVPAVGDAELRRVLRKPPESLGAWEVNQRGQWHLGKATAADTEQARGYFERAIALDGTFARAYSNLAFTYVTEGGVFATRLLGEAARLAAVMARKAVEYDPDDAEALATLAYAAFATGNRQEAGKWASLANECGANSAWANGIKGALLVWSGNGSEGREAVQTALRLNPRDSRNRLFASTIAASYYMERDYAAAIEAAAWAITQYPAYPNPYRWLAASLGQLGRVDEAQEAVRKAIAVSRTGFDLHVRSRPQWFLPQQHEHLLDGLRKAGWQG